MVLPLQTLPQRHLTTLLPYVGPEDSLQRFLAGAVVTKEEFVRDQSLWTVKAVLPAQMKRLKWMLDNRSQT